MIMKKIVLAAFMLLAFAMQAQTVTEANLQGTWRMAFVTNEMGTVDIAKGTWQLKEKNNGTPNSADEMFNDMVLMAQETKMVFKGNTVSWVVSGKEHTSGFTLKDKDGKTYITMDDDAEHAMHVFFKDGNMYMTAAGVEIVYKQTQQ